MTFSLAGWSATSRSSSRRDATLATWAAEQHLHAGREIEQALRQRFEISLMTYGQYFFSDLDGMTHADEQAAIDSGQIQATGIYFVARITDATWSVVAGDNVHGTALHHLDGWPGQVLERRVLTGPSRGAAPRR